MKRLNSNGVIDVDGTLDAVLIRKDGSHRNYGQISNRQGYDLIGRPIQWWRAVWRALRGSVIPATMGFAAFLAAYAVVDQPELMHKLISDPRVLSLIMGGPLVGLVTTNGANFLATDMASGQASPRISSMNFHDSGIGTTAATSTDAGLQTQAGPTTRATGTQSNPTSNVYRSVGQINYASGLAITEWGLFNQAAQGGTMWDHRVFGAINVLSGDSIQFTYSLTVTAGGS